MLRILGRLATVAVVCCFVALAVVGWRVFTDTEPAPGQDSARTAPDQGNGYYSDLELREGDLGDLSGEITVYNDSSDYQDVLVNVAVFDGEQNVGSLSGMGTIKPNSSTNVDLISGDNYVDWTDAHVEILGLE